MDLRNFNNGVYSMNEILFEDLKKGDEIKHSHLGSTPLVTGIIKESPKQGRGLKSYHPGRRQRLRSWHVRRDWLDLLEPDRGCKTRWRMVQG